MAQTHTGDKNAELKNAQAKQAEAEKAKQPAPTAGEQAEAKKQKETKDSKKFTYIGAGEDSPRVINFMGKQTFIRGELTTVSDPDVLRKLDGNPTFVEGKADQETLHRIDEEAKHEADLQRLEDAKINKAYSRKHRTA